MIIAIAVKLIYYVGQLIMMNAIWGTHADKKMLTGWAENTI